MKFKVYFLVTFLILNLNQFQSTVASKNGSVLTQNFFSLYNLKLSRYDNVQCKNHIEKTIVDAESGQTWALKILDASSKLQSGLLSGNLADLGSFDQCLHIREPSNLFRGKYCLSKISINKAGPFFRHSICIPDSCSASEIETALKVISTKISSIVGFTFDVALSEDDCQTTDSQFKMETGDYIVIAFLTLTLLLIIISTIYDITLTNKKQSPPSPVLVAFSVYSNGKRLFKLNKNKDLLPCLDGIRFLSMLWIIMAHRFEKNIQNFNINTLEIEQWSKTLGSLFVSNSTISVDTFFLLSGCLMMYGYLKAKARGVPFNIPLYYIHRYLRVTPALAVVMIMHVTLYRHFGSGPIWPSTVKSEYDNCKQYWWSSLLYVQNYVNPKQFCVGQAWYLSVDMQLFWVSPFILLSVSKWKRYALHILTLLTLIFVIVPFCVSWDLELRAVGFSGFYEYYVTTHCRAATWLIGLFLGFVLYEHRTKKYTINHLTVGIGWILSLLAMFYIILGVYSEMRDDYVYDRWFNSFYIALHRAVWCSALAWIIFACVRGYGGPVNAFLSLPVFQPLSRLTYCMYLTHVSLIYMKVGKTRVPLHFSTEEYIYMFWGDVCTTLIVSLVWSLAFEIPWSVIDGVLIGKAKKSMKPTNRDNNDANTLNETGGETKIDMTKNTPNVG